MKSEPSDTPVSANDKNSSSDRRNFIKSAAAAGVLGAVGMAAGVQPASGAQQTADQAQDIPNPPGMPAHASFDCRHPVSYNKSVVESTKILMQYYEALATRDLGGMAECMHFPFVTYEGPYAVLVETKDKFMATPPPSMNVTGKGDNRIKEGSYDLLENTQMHVFDPVGVGHTLMYSRYEPGGQRILQCHGIYGVTNNDGKWGLEFMSTIFKPANQIGRDESYTLGAADQALHDNHRDKVMSRREADLPMVRKMVIYPYPHASVGIGPGGGPGNSGVAFRVKGVKSRLRYSPGDTQQQEDKQSWNMDHFAEASGAGVGLWGNSIEIPETRILYAEAAKGHYYSGYYRYTPNATVISEYRYLGCEIRRQGVWYGHDIATTFGQVVYHDWSNDGVKG